MHRTVLRLAYIVSNCFSVSYTYDIHSQKRPPKRIFSEQCLTKVFIGEACPQTMLVHSHGKYLTNNLAMHVRMITTRLNLSASQKCIQHSLRCSVQVYGLCDVKTINSKLDWSVIFSNIKFCTWEFQHNNNRDVITDICIQLYSGFKSVVLVYSTLDFNLRLQYLSEDFKADSHYNNY